MFSYSNDAISFQVKPEFLWNITENKGIFGSEILPTRITKKESISNSDEIKDSFEINHGDKSYEHTEVII